MLEESPKQLSADVPKENRWIHQWPYILLVLSLLGAIGTGIPGLSGLGPTEREIAWFHVSVFMALAFVFIGAAQYVHDALVDLKSHVEVKDKPLNDAISSVEQLAANLRTDVRCEFAGDDDAALHYLMSKCHGHELLTIQGTFVQSDENHRPYSSETYKSIGESLRIFLSRPETFLEQIVTPKADRRLIDTYMDAASDTEKQDPTRIAWHRLADETPILNFRILTYRENGGTEKTEEVLFGGSRYASESNEAVFKSRDPRVVQEFKDLYEMLSRSAKRVTSSALRAHLNRGAAIASEIHEKWEQSRLYALMNQIEPANRENENPEGDLRISTSFFIDYFGLREDVLLPLREKGARIKVLLMDPDNIPLIEARFGLRRDGLDAVRAKPDLLSDIRSLSEFKNIELRVSDSMPCGFVVHSKDWAVVGLMPAQSSYVTGPMIETAAGTRTWNVLQEDWNVRWSAAKPYALIDAAMPIPMRS